MFDLLMLDVLITCLAVLLLCSNIAAGPALLLCSGVEHTYMRGAMLWGGVELLLWPVGA